MGWFDEQIREKIKNERESFSDAWMEMTGAVTGNAGGSFWGWDDRAAAIRAVSEILNFYHVKPQEIPDSIEENAGYFRISDAAVRLYAAQGEAFERLVSKRNRSDAWRLPEEQKSRCNFAGAGRIRGCG